MDQYEATTKTSLGVSAEDFYNQQRSNRNGVVSIGRRLADMIIPSIFPPENYDTTHDSLAITQQSVNAECIMGLATSLTLSGIPPELPMCKIEVIESKLKAEVKQDPALYAEINYSMSRREEAHRKRIATTKARLTYTTVMQQLLVVGNCLILWTDINNPISYNLHSYVVLRDTKGMPIVTVLKETISLAVVDEDVANAVMENRERMGKPLSVVNKWEDTADIYHVMKFCPEEGEKGEWLYWQEVEGGWPIVDTEFYSDYDTPPMWPATLILETGSNYGLGYASMFEGDHSTMEELSSSVRDASAMLSWFLTFVDPTGMTNIRDVRKADNLAILPGRADDISSYTSGKTGEIMQVAQHVQEVARRLGRVYASEASIQRSGERVTKEEWVQMSKALEKAMGSLYSYITQSVLRWFILRFIYLHQQEDKDLGKLPKDIVSVDVASGVDNIGRSSEYDNLMALGTDMAGLFSPQIFGQRANVDDWSRRLAAGRAIKFDGLMKSTEELTAEAQQAQQQQQQQALLEKGTAPVVQGGMDALTQMMKPQQQQE